MIVVTAVTVVTVVTEVTTQLFHQNTYFLQKNVHKKKSFWHQKTFFPKKLRIKLGFFFKCDETKKNLNCDETQTLKLL